MESQERNQRSPHVNRNKLVTNSSQHDVSNDTATASQPANPSHAPLDRPIQTRPSLQPGDPLHHRQSLSLASNRRATMLFRTMDHSQPPVEDPNNTPEDNEERWREYETIRQLNQAISTIMDDFSLASKNIKQFKETVDQTDQLLDVWAKILSQAEHTKRLLQDPNWHGQIAELYEQDQPARQMTTTSTSEPIVHPTHERPTKPSPTTNASLRRPTLPVKRPAPSSSGHAGRIPIYPPRRRPTGRQ